LKKVSICTYIILLEEPRVLESIFGGEDDVLEEFSVGERRHVVVAAEILGETLQSLRVDAAGVDPLWFCMVSVVDVGRRRVGDGVA